jgi:hypothetical protein
MRGSELVWCCGIEKAGSHLVQGPPVRPHGGSPLLEEPCAAPCILRGEARNIKRHIDEAPNEHEGPLPDKSSRITNPCMEVER